MQKKLATKWVKALRSGKYKQADGALVKYSDLTNTVLGHCCLGVLGEVCGINPKEMNGAGMLDGALGGRSGLKTPNGAPCDGVDEFGYPQEQGELSISVKSKKTGKVKKKEFESLAVANDEGVSFKQIANWIEKNYKLL